MFELSFKIEGVQELHRVLMAEVGKVENMTEPLRRSGQLVLADVQENFRTEGGLVGGWVPLAPGTVKQRGSANPILQRTGAYKGSFTQHVTRKSTAISSFAPYHKYHQSLLPRSRLPRRPTLALVERTRQNIVEVFNKYLRFGS